MKSLYRPMKCRDDVEEMLRHLYILPEEIRENVEKNSVTRPLALSVSP